MPLLSCLDENDETSSEPKSLLFPYAEYICGIMQTPQTVLNFWLVILNADHINCHGGRHTVFWVGHGPPKNFFGWAIMHLAHPKNAGAK
jgi:hypothetical protein